ncbi:unnamed protein product, partial [Prorocentrum cordatum]
RQQDATIRILQARVDTMSSPPPPPPSWGGRPDAPGTWDRAWKGGAVDAVRGRDRSRTPAPGPPPMQAPPPAPRHRPPQLAGASAVGDTAAVDEFAEANGLDDNCREALRQKPPDIQEQVIQQGPVDGRNPSAMVMARIAKLMSGGGGGGGGGPVPVSGGFVGSESADDVAAQVDDFILANAVDDMCADTLRNQTIECQLAVLAKGRVEGRNVSAMIMGRIQKFVRGQL